MKIETQSKDPSRFIEPGRSTGKEVEYRQALESYYQESIGTDVEKLQNFAKYVPAQDLRKFLCRAKLFEKVLTVQGSIIECGVLYGGGVMTWAQLSEIYEPLNHTRNIIGFDTFEGFATVSKQDATDLSVQSRQGGLAIDSMEDTQRSAALHDRLRFLPHIQKVRLVRGDVRKTLPVFLKDNPHTVVSLLYLDFDTYDPTLAALEHLLPRMPKGSILAFDELNHEVWPGETIAVMEAVGLRNLRIERFPFGGTLSYAVLD